MVRVRACVVSCNKRDLIVDASAHGQGPGALFMQTGDSVEAQEGKAVRLGCVSVCV